MNGTRVAIYEDRIAPEPMTGCWLWTGALAKNGYGSIKRDGKVGAAHRVFYQILVGEIPAGMHLLHSCDVRCCVNPAHLRIGTNLDNIVDSMRKGRRKGVARNRPSGLKYKPMSEAGRWAHTKAAQEAKRAMGERG